MNKVFKDNLDVYVVVNLDDIMSPLTIPTGTSDMYARFCDIFVPSRQSRGVRVQRGHNGLPRFRFCP